MTPADVHALPHERFLAEVHSFDFWFQSVEGYLSGTTHGLKPGAPSAPLGESDRRQLIAVLCNYCVGETAALEGASGLIAIAPSRNTKIFLSTQVVDEGRHLEVLLHRLRALGVADPEQEVERQATASMGEFRRRLLGLVHGRDWDAAIFAQNVILESLEFAVFHEHARVADPLTAELLRGIIKDERRHIGFGENEIGRRVSATPSVRARLAATRRELDPLVVGALEDTAGRIGVPASDTGRLVRAYRESVERLGVAA